ncbi:MAG: CPBP family intramembrane glutamic endopeptidase [Candidatus Korobacteraceae bacterium]
MLPSDPLPAAHRESQLRTMFVGPYGIRAGWRVVIFFALLATLFAVTTPLQRLVVRRLGTDFSAPNVILGEIFAFGMVLVVTGIMARFEHRRLVDYGLPARGMLGKNFWKGALWGFVMLSVIIGMMTATHAYSPGTLALSSFAILKYGFLWAVAFLMVGFFEEFTFRGYVQFTLTWGLGFWPAAGITCTIFALAHSGNPGENWVGVVEIILIALFLCVALRRTGNLWFAIGWHMAFDWGESFFYSTPNSGIHATGHLLNASLRGSKWLSGGTVGPEASVFDLIVTIAGILLLAKLYPEAKYPASLPAMPANLPEEQSSPELLPPAM